MSVTKVIYRLAHKRKCVFRDVRIKTKVGAKIRAESVWVKVSFVDESDFQKERK